MSLAEIQHIHIVGIKGVANANLAIILKQMGKSVTGSDVKEKFITETSLLENNIKVYTDFSADNLSPEIQLVVFTGAHGGRENVEVQTARKRNLKIQSQAELVGELTSLFNQTLAVCGCHGKTTTSSLLAQALIELKAKPSYLIGTANFGSYPAGKYNDKEYFVLEADEYGIDPPRDLRPKFSSLRPSYTICTNIDYDHPDVYPSLEATKDAFKTFFHNTLNQQKKNSLILNADDVNVKDTIRDFPRDQYVTYGYDDSANLRIQSGKHTSDLSTFKLTWNGEDLGEFTTKFFGEKLIANVAGVVLLLLVMGFKTEEIKAAVATFDGAKRRFEHITAIGDFDLYDDYAHHPAEISATIQAAQSKFPGRRIILIFQPHTYSRTASLKSEFVTELDKADLSLILPIFASARESNDQVTVQAVDLEELSKNKHTIAVDSPKDLKSILATSLQPGDVIFTLGAGDVYKLKNDIIEVCQALTSRLS